MTDLLSSTDKDQVGLSVPTRYRPGQAWPKPRTCWACEIRRSNTTISIFSCVLRHDRRPVTDHVWHAITLTGVKACRIGGPAGGRRSHGVHEHGAVTLRPPKVSLAKLTPAFYVWPAAMAAHRDAALLLMGFTGAHRRSELVNLQMRDVSVHRTDGLHVRLRSSKTDQEGAGTVRALPYGKDPATCPPCALIRWRRILLAYDDGGRAAAMAQVHRRGVATEHCCRDTDTDTDVDDVTVDSAGGGPVSVGERWLFPTVHRTGHPAERR